MAFDKAVGEPENSQLLSTPLPSVCDKIDSIMSSFLPSTTSAPNFFAKSILIWLSQSIAITNLAPMAFAAFTANRPIGPRPCMAITESATGPPVKVWIALPSGSWIDANSIGRFSGRCLAFSAGIVK